MKAEIKSLFKKVQAPANSLGIASEIFADCKVAVTVKNLNKRVSFNFIADDGTSLRVNASQAINDMYRANQITVKQMLSLPVYATSVNAQGEPLTDKITGEPITVYSLGSTETATSGYIRDIKIEKYVPEVVDLDSLA